ncbi:hypothetical protein [Xanthomonas arboricola]|uniref:hypothetical protein n=1 Tax=Xanthomonas arboricola TaxID=56448 RepID=UPI0009B8EB12|nr:hypothetical protein [Xanthomonas arboricola]
MSRNEPALSATDKRLVEELVNQYIESKKLIGAMLEQLLTALQSSDTLMKSVHSLRWRLKDADHLKDKLERKIKESKRKREKFIITKENLFENINDLAGVRLLHLHTGQIVDIDRELSKVFSSYRYQVVEAAKARTWDDEYRNYYESIGISTVNSPKMYTSVHYVVSPNMTEKFTCEIQVRTLAEELWGEVDHSMNYPHESSIETCRSQIRVLARVTSSCSRLVDSIYESAGRQKKQGALLSDKKLKNKSNGSQVKNVVKKVVKKKVSTTSVKK